MEIIGIGTDIIEVSRIRNLLNRYGKRFLDRIFTDMEQDYCMKKRFPEIHLAGKFSAKEAVIKSLDGVFPSLPFNSLEIVNSDSGKPGIKFTENFIEKNREALSDLNFQLSITHSDSCSVAFAICSRRIK